MLDEALRLFLLGFPGVIAEVVARIFPAPFPQGTVMPSITYQVISRTSSVSTDGPDCLSQNYYQLNHWSLTREGSVRLESLTRSVLQGYHGTWPNSIRIGGVFLQNRWAMYEEETKLWRVIADYKISAFEGE